MRLSHEHNAAMEVRMQTRLPVILLELNELSPILMERFISGGKLPNFKRLRDRSVVFLSEAEERAPDLEPWIQWVNVHTGVPYSEHGVSRLSEGHKLQHKCIWEVVSDSGAPVWVCGSMNVRYEPTIRGWILPDPWSTDVAPHPDSLQPYFRFIQQNVLEHTRDRVSLSKSDYAQFLRFMVGNGLSLRTLNSILKQLASEKRTGAGRWRRAFLMDKLQFDLFSAVYERLKPSFSTFFLNSTAHMQHMYWRDMEPDKFKVARAPDKQKEYATAILQGYQEMDVLIGRLLTQVGDDALIIMATALSQQPCLDYEEAGGKRGHRIHDFSALLAFAGVTARFRVAPVMAEQFWIHFENRADAEDAQTKLSALHVVQQRAIETGLEGNSVFAACAIRKFVAPEALLQVAGADRSIPFFQMFYAAEGLKSGMHHPDGMLWIRDPRQSHAMHPEKVGLVSIAPTILDLLGVEKPAYMKGESLTREFALEAA
jgi:hypothetical protein